MVMKTEMERIKVGKKSLHAMRAAMSVRGVEDRLKCHPSPELNTFIYDREFRIRFKLYCLIKLFEGVLISTGTDA